MIKTPWLSEIVAKWAASIAHVFILHGNVDDIVVPGRYVRDHLVASNLLAKRDCVIVYNRSKGIYFPLPSHQQVFMELTGLAEQSGQNPALLALQEARGGSNEQQLPKDPVSAFLLIEKALTAVNEDGQPRCALIIEYAETIVPAQDFAMMPPENQNILVTLLRWSREPEFSQIGPPVFLLTGSSSDLHMSLRDASSRIECVEVELPDENTRKAILSQLKESLGVEIDVDAAAAMTAGLKNVHIEDIVLRAKLQDSPVAADLIKARKNEILRAEFSEVLELLDPDQGFESIGGLEHVKAFFFKNVINPIKNGNLRRVPLGILMPGPPGTGKTVLAKAVAKESGINCANHNLSKIMDKWIGSSERAMERLFACLRALAPCLVIVDEIDQMGISREGDGTGVSNRLFKMLLEFMADTNNRGRIVFLGMTNRPDMIDAALKRPGRFDRKIPILPPDTDERQEVLRVIFNKYDIAYDLDLAPIAEATDGYTGAELETLVLKAHEVAEDNGHNTVTLEDVKYALDVYVPTTGDIQRQTLLALQECNDKDLLPPKYRDILEQRRKAQEAQEEIKQTSRTIRSV